MLMRLFAKVVQYKTQIVESAHSRRNSNGVVILIREVAGILGEFDDESHICEL